MLESGKYVEGSPWFYAPNKAAPVVFGVAFGISMVWHLYQCIRFKSFRVTALHPFTCSLMLGGFICRTIGAFSYTQPKIYIAATSLLYFSPPILELANYHVFGRILYYVPYHSPINPGRTLTTFGMLSAVVEILNALGVAWTANPAIPHNLMNIGDAMLKASLIIQILVIFMFCSMVGFFHSRVARGGVLTRATYGPCYTMYISSLLILIRSVFRTVQHFSTVPLGSADAPKTVEGMNQMSPTIRYEWYFYVFEALVLAANELMWNIRHPRYYLPEDYHVYLAQDGVTELVGPGWRDERMFLLTTLDPFGCFDGKKRKQPPFWETNGFSKVGSNDSYTKQRKITHRGERRFR